MEDFSSVKERIANLKSVICTDVDSFFPSDEHNQGWHWGWSCLHHRVDLLLGQLLSNSLFSPGSAGLYVGAGRGNGHVADGDVDPGEATSVKTYVNMRVQRIFKWTHISEVDDCKITPFSDHTYPYLRGVSLNFRRISEHTDLH